MSLRLTCIAAILQHQFMTTGDSSAEYVNEKEPDELEDENGDPLITDSNELENSDASLHRKSEIGEDNTTDEGDSSITRTTSDIELQSALQGGGDDRNDE